MLEQKKQIVGNISTENSLKGKFNSETIGVEKDYNNLLNKPKINSIELRENKTLEQLGIQEKMENLTNLDIENILKKFI